MQRSAYSYIRFSSEKQSQGSSLERQVKAAKEYADKHNLHLDTSTYQALGVSGFRGRDAEEGALKSFLDAVEDKRIPAGSVLIVENMDRLSRDHVDRALAVFLSIISKGITIITLTDPPKEFSSKTIRDSRGFDVMWAIQDMVRAHEESKRKREFAIDKWTERRAKVANAPSTFIMTRSVPPWLEVNADKSAFVKLHKKVAIVQRIFDLSINGMGAQLMATTFNREKVPQLGDAKEWRAQEFIRYLKWEAVTGTLVSKDRYTGAETNRIENYYPAIVSNDDFKLAQAAMRQRKSVGRGRKGLVVSNLFSGLIRCGSCGSGCRMTTKYGAFYLECLSARSKGVCKAPRFNYDSLEPALLWLIAAHERIELAPPSGKTAC